MEEIEVQAKEMGWVPKEEFKGNPEKWVDAETYVEKGREIMPIMQANNRRLLSEVSGLKTQIQTVLGDNKVLRETIDSLKEFQEESARQQFDRAKASLLNDKKLAKKEGDVDAEVEIDEALRQLETRKPDETKKEETKKEAVTVPPTAEAPWFIEWKAKNPWVDTDPVKSATAVGVGRKLMMSGMKPGPEMMEKISEEIETIFSTRSTGDKVDGSRGGAGSSSTSGGKGGKRSWNDLPADAQAACERFSARLVGPNRAYKTVEEHRKAYVQQYFAGE